MDSLIMTVLVLMACSLWLFGGLLQLYNLRRQEQLIEQLRHLLGRRPRMPRITRPVAPESLADTRRSAQRWTVE